jgi:nicotinamidase/pyrazinamidase
MIFFDVDTQVDFMHPEHGALYVRGADEIAANIEKLLSAAGVLGITTGSTSCAHEPDDPEFEIFPPHCIEGTRGAERIYSDLPALPRRIIDTRASEDLEATLMPATHYVIKKRVFDPFSNRWLDGLRKRGVFSGEHAIVFGVATDYCVRATALGLREGGAEVDVIEDAIRGVSDETTRTSLGELEVSGIRLTTTDEVLRQVKKLKDDEMESPGDKI